MQEKLEQDFRGEVNVHHRNINNTSTDDIKTIWDCPKTALLDTTKEVCETNK